jgi:cytochrome c peroxidase
MKKAYIFIVLLMSALVFVTSALRPQQDLNSSAQKVVELYRQDWQQLLQALEALQTALQQPQPDPQNCQKLHLQARLAFKRASFLAEYLDPEFLADYINGAPLPKLERNFSQVNALSPKGFQPLEELLYEDVYSPELLAEARELCNGLLFSVSDFARFDQQRRIQDYQVLEALRYGLIRFMSLSLVGFDQPASGEQLREMQAQWQSMQAASAAFTTQLGGNQQKLGQEIEKKWLAGSKQLAKTKDFDGLNRAAIIRETLNPLFSNLLYLQQALQLPMSKQLYPGKYALNYEATSLFDNQLLNPFYYAQLVPEMYNPSTIALGKLLFFDPVLSESNERACASCHQPELAFSDGAAKSIATGFQGTIQRNAPGLINSVYSPRFFWDLRATQLENQFAHVVINELEFNSSVLDIMQRLGWSSEYMALFNTAFPAFNNNAVNQYTINTALAAYISSLRSFNSPFDQYMRGEKAQIAPEVLHGFNIFMGKGLCGTCHFAPSFGGIVPPLYTEQESEVLGVPAQAQAPYSLDTDLGRAAGLPKEQHPIYNNSFKTVTVRNAALTAPYMHNGVYQSLAEVVDFYAQGGGAGLGLEVPNQTLPFDSLSLNAQEKRALIAFMEALTDTTGLTSRPLRLPKIDQQLSLNKRIIGGAY